MKENGSAVAWEAAPSACTREAEPLRLSIASSHHSRPPTPHTLVFEKLNAIEAVPCAGSVSGSQSTMAPRRGLNLISSWQGFTSGLFRATVSWLRPIKAQKGVPNTKLIRITPIERALKDMYGDQWKERANHQQRSYVRMKEFHRARRQEKCMSRQQPMRRARDDEYDAEWHQSVECWKTRLLKEQEARDASGKRKSRP
ncbi:hypothetical protein LA080_010485 [Diaporthe eres]|nr:hypothetical protein LA080_010485 [Diaporthe eres]